MLRPERVQVEVAAVVTGEQPALRAAGIDYRPPCALRHTFATFAIAAKVPLFELARFMGTSVEQIDATYGQLLP